MRLSTRTTRRFLIAAAVAGAGALIAGCGGSSEGASTHVSSASLSRAADLSSGAAGFKVMMVMRENVDGKSIVMSGNGLFNTKPTAGSMIMNLSADGQTFPIQVVIAGDTIYEQLPSQLASELPGGKTWISINLNELGAMAKVPGLSSLTSSDSSMTDPGQYLNFLKAASAGSVQDLGQATVGGVQTTHYSANVELSKLPDAVPQSARSATAQLVATLHSQYKTGDIPMDVWIDQSDLIRKVQMSFNESVQGQAVTATLTEQITAYGKQPAPTVPSAGETTNLLSLISSGG
jgi:hypothetical protein